MRLGPKALVGLGLGLALTRNKGGVVGPYPAPPGYRWVGVVSDGIPVVSDGVRVVTLVGV